MASANFEKLKSPQEVKSRLRHCDKEERLNHDHNNEHIDKSITGSNLQYERSYKESCDMYDERIKYLDSLDGANKRKDRVTCFGIEIPCPLGLQEDMEEQWMNDINNIVTNQYGSVNVIGMYLHRDEKHEYMDSETAGKKMSRTHIHFYVVPEVDSRLNGKQFSSKANIMKLNNAIHDMTQSRYGLDFMDGTKRKSKASVESLKNKSRELELDDRERQLDDRELDLLQREEDLISSNASVNALKARLEDFLSQVDNLSLKYKDGLNELNSALEQYKPSNDYERMKSNSVRQVREEDFANLEKRRRRLELMFGDIVSADERLREEEGREL